MILSEVSPQTVAQGHEPPRRSLAAVTVFTQYLPRLAVHGAAVKGQKRAPHSFASRQPHVEPRFTGPVAFRRVRRQ